MRVLKLHDITITMLAISSLALKCLIFCFANSKNVLYAILAVGLFDNLVTQPLRSTLTKIVGPQDVGKVNCNVMFLAAIATLYVVMSAGVSLCCLVRMSFKKFFCNIICLI